MRLKIVALGVEESGCSGLRPWQHVRGLLGEPPFLLQRGWGMSLSSAMAFSVRGRSLWGRECPSCYCRPPWLSPRSCIWSLLRPRCITKASRSTLRWVLPQSRDRAAWRGDSGQEHLVGIFSTEGRVMTLLRTVLIICLFFSEKSRVSQLRVESCLSAWKMPVQLTIEPHRG